MNEVAVAAEYGPRVLGDYLRNLRESQNMTLREVADKSGVSHGYIGMLERGVIESPAVDKLAALASVYGVEPSHLIALAYGVEPAPTNLPPDIDQHVRKLLRVPSKEREIALRMIDALFENFSDRDEQAVTREPFAVGRLAMAR